MEKLITHPLEVYVAYILIAVSLTFYLSRAKGDLSSIQPGSSFTVMISFKILAALVFLGMPGGLVFFLPEAIHIGPAVAMTIGIVFIFTLAYIALISTRLIITEDGLIIKGIGWNRKYRFDEFKAVVVFRYNIVLEKKIHRGINPAFPAIFSNTAGLHRYLKNKIEVEPAGREA